MKYCLYYLLSFIALYCAYAQEYINRDYKFSINLSSKQGWSKPQIIEAASGNLIEPTKFVLVSTNTNSDSRVSIQIMKVNNDLSLNDPQVREGSKKGFLESFQIKSQIISEKLSITAGVPSYELVLQSIHEESPITVRLIEIIANGYQYNLIAMSKGTVQSSHPEIDAVLASFRFIESPPIRADSSATKNIGYIIGRITGYVIVLFVIGYIVYRIRKKRNKPKM